MLRRDRKSVFMGEILGFTTLMHQLYLLTKETGIRLARIGGLLHPMSVVRVLGAWPKDWHGIRVLNRRWWRKQYIEVSSAT
jgi:hypothetical protein